LRRLRRFLTRAANFVTRRGDLRLREEMEEHLCEQAREYVRAGMSPDEARRQAVLKFGAVEAVREKHHAEQGLPLLEELGQDIRYAFRLLARSPGFTIAAVITLGLGVGVNASLFSLIDAIGIRTLPVKDSASLVSIYQQYRGQVHARGVYGSPYYLSYPEYANYRDRNSTFSGLAAYAETGLALGGADPQPVSGQLVSCNYFSVLGAEFSIGRGFNSDDCRASAAPTAILSHRFWQSHYGDSRSVVGNTLTLNGQTVTVAGVAPAGFSGTELQVPDVWVPVTAAPQLLPITFGSRDWLALGNVSWLQVVGHLKPGISRRVARSELAVLARQMDAIYPGRQTVVIVNASSFVNNPEARTDGLWIGVAVFMLGALVLTMACTNLANLLLSRGARRQQELVTRLALGATRRRMLSQLLTENMLLSALGGLAGVAVMLWLTPVIVHALPGMPSGPLPLNLAPNFTTLSFALMATLTAALLSGVAPAIQATGPDLLTALKEGGAAAGHGRRRARLRDLLVITQVAGCFLLLSLAGLLARGLYRAQIVAPGFTTQNVYVLSFDLSERGYNGTRALEFARELRERLGDFAGTDGVASSSVLPGVSADLTGVSIPGPDHPGEEVLANYVSPEYFRTMEIPILRGHAFTGDELHADGLSPALVSTAMAQRFWPAENPIGKEFLAGQNRRYQVVGIVPNVSTLHLGQNDGPLFYGLIAETGAAADTKLFLRANGDASSAVSAIPALVRQIDPNVTVTTEPYQQILSEQLLPARRGAILVSAFGLLALVLAVVGVTGVVSLATSQRVREICIRIAFGARRHDVVVLLLGHGVKLVVVGLGAGLGLAAGFAALLAGNGLLFGVSPIDPAVFLGTASLLFCSAVSSMLFPALRAIRVDPVVALRYE
jgi:macrolide transport system ATP-binding/permease protein